jgi:hypothetical protein
MISGGLVLLKILMWSSHYGAQKTGFSGARQHLVINQALCERFPQTRQHRIRRRNDFDSRLRHPLSDSVIEKKTRQIQLATWVLRDYAPQSEYFLSSVHSEKGKTSAVLLCGKWTDTVDEMD